MVDKSRIKLMTKMASYDQKLSEEDADIYGYFKKDYVSLKTLTSALWITFAYAIIVIAGVFCYIDRILNNLSIGRIITISVIIFAAYIVLLVAYCVCAHNFYKRKYTNAKKRIKRYYKQIVHLQRMYAKEKKL